MEFVELMAKIKPKGGGTFPMVDAVDIDMGDDVRLPEVLDDIRDSMAYSIVEGDHEIKPEHYHVFGEVESLAVTLVELDDEKAHEYVFEFTPADGFAGLTISPEPVWLGDPQFPIGKPCIVSIVRGKAVAATEGGGSGGSGGSGASGGSGGSGGSGEGGYRIPETLPNPHALTITGAVNATYDGRAPVSIEIPSGGGGINVTGAEVGQIVKIAEVDENGRPLAWETADLEKDWTPIINVTLEESAVYVYTDADINGNPFSVKELFVVGMMPKDETISKAYMAIGPKFTSWSTAQGICYVISLNSTAKYFSGTLKVIGTTLRHHAFYMGGTEYNASGVSSYGGLLDGYDLGGTSMNSVAIGFTNNAYAMPVGTILRVWGR